MLRIKQIWWFLKMMCEHPLTLRENWQDAATMYYMQTNKEALQTTKELENLEE
jgi:hypothetical protein